MTWGYLFIDLFTFYFFFFLKNKNLVAGDFRGCAGIVWGGHRGLQCVASLKRRSNSG